MNATVGLADNREHHADVKIGVMVDVREKGPVRDLKGVETQVRALLDQGMESMALSFWQSIGDFELDRLAERIGPVLEEEGAVFSALTMFGNPLAEDETGKRAAGDWKRLIELAGEIGCPLVTGFTGALTGRPILDSVPRLKEVFGPLAELAGEKGVKLAFENCKMGSSWQRAGTNLMYNPDGWEVVFEALPYENVGLEWEPGHVVVQLGDPIANLREWAHKIMHVHGKDGRVCHDLLRRYGILSKRRVTWQTMPGFGDTDWTTIISELRRHGYVGAIDIEGYHDPVYRGNLEMTGQAAAIRYLKACRGGEYVANPDFG